MSAIFGSSEDPPRDQTIIIACAKHPDRLPTDQRYTSCTACTWIELAQTNGIAITFDGRGRPGSLDMESAVQRPTRAKSETLEEMTARIQKQTDDLLARMPHYFWLHWSPLGRSCPEGECPYE